jgi:hypothetical protein
VTRHPERPAGPRPWLVAVAVVLLLALGASVAGVVREGLRLSARPARVPVERSVAAAPAAAVPPPPIAAVVVPGDRRLERAATAVAEALAARGLARPVVTGVPRGPGKRLRVEVTPAAGGASSPEAFVLDDDGDLTVRAATVAGAASGLYTVADRVRTGVAVLPPGERGTVVAPRLPLRLTDAGSVGREPDRAAFVAGTDYGLNTDVVGEALLPRAPWVDDAAVERISAQFRQFVDHALTQGYNGIVVPGFLEYVTFDRVGGGHDVHPAGGVHEARARAMSAAFAPVFRYAADQGMRVYLLTDMLAVSLPLERYLTRTVGGLDTEDPRLWAVYAAGLAELFDAMPFVSGLMVRVGEGGDVYRRAGWDLGSRIAVTTPEAVRAMLAAFLRTAGAAGKEVVFRTWTVGVGAVGDLHTNPASYEEVLGPVRAPNLVVSTKYTLGDFYSHLPFNDTLTVGHHRRIVELQARREFEGSGALPNDLTVLHRDALRSFLAANPRVEGVWTWTQDGGPLRAGPMSLYLRAGFWQLYDLNAYAAARLARDPDTDPAAITAAWARATFSDDPRTVAAVGRVMALSRAAVTTGLYVRPYADRRVRALGLEPPPMLWIFEWDILTGDTAALGVVYRLSRDRLAEAVADGDRAVALAGEMRRTLAATEPRTWRDPRQRERFLATLDYQVDLFRLLGAYRATVLHHAHWLDTGSGASREAWRAAERRYEAARAEHLRRYAGDVDLPAYNVTAADLGLVRAGRDPAMAALARVLLVGSLAALLLGTVPGQRILRRAGVPGGPALRALWLGATRPWRLAAEPAPASRTDRWPVLLVPVVAVAGSRLTLTWFAAPTHVSVVLAAWLLYAVTARLLLRGRDPHALWAAVGGVALLRSVLLLAVLSVRGPGYLWLRFWTAETPRTVYVVLAVAAFGWLFAATALVLRYRYGLRRRRALGVTLAAAGVPSAVLGGLVAGVGLERALTAWNDDLTLLPWGLSRILGITVHLGIPAQLPVVVAAGGLGLVAAAGALAIGVTRRSPPV